MQRRIFTILFLYFLMSSIFIYSGKKDVGLISDRLATEILNEVSGEKALDYVYNLIKFDRITGSHAYDRAAEYVIKKLKEFGIDDVRIESFPAEWNKNYYLKEKPSWWPPIGWTVKKGILKIVNPEKKIADYDEEPITLARMSRSFRGKAELVFVGKGTSENDYTGLDVKGKIVLAKGNAWSVYNLAVLRKGAIGVICFGPSSYSNFKGKGYPDMEVWQVLSPYENEGKKPQYAFSVSEKKGNYLLSLLKSQKKVEVEVDVQTEFYENDLKIVNGRIPGVDKTKEEFLFYAHLDHVKPSAGDNASGCAVTLEIARVILKLIKEGKIEQPKRSIRFIWGPEGPGSFMYINAHIDKLESTLGGLNLDMVGQDMAKTHSILRITRTPDSLPSFMGDLVQNLIENLDTRFVKAPTGKRNFLNYRFIPYTANSDHFFFNDGAVGVPMMMFNYSPDEFHHTNIDTPDKLEPTELKRIAYLSAAVALFVATADDKDALDLAQIMASNGNGRIFQSIQKGLVLLRTSKDTNLLHNYKAGKNYIHSTAKREIEAVRSFIKLCNNERVIKEIEDLAKNCSMIENLALDQMDRIYQKNCTLRNLKPQRIELTKEEKKALQIIPQRRGRYLNLHWERKLKENHLDEDDQHFLKDFKQRFIDSYIRIPEILNFVDGKNNLLEIRDAVSSEYFGFMTANNYVGHSEDLSQEYRNLEIEDLIRLMEIFKKAGLVIF